MESATDVSEITGRVNCQFLKVTINGRHFTFLDCNFHNWKKNYGTKKMVFELIFFYYRINRHFTLKLYALFLLTSVVLFLAHTDLEIWVAWLGNLFVCVCTLVCKRVYLFVCDKELFSMKKNGKVTDYGHSVQTSKYQSKRRSTSVIRACKNHIWVNEWMKWTRIYRLMFG